MLRPSRNRRRLATEAWSTCIALRSESAAGQFQCSQSRPSSGLGGAFNAATETGLRAQLAWQMSHWRDAADRLDEFDSLVPTAAWVQLETYVGAPLRGNLRQLLHHLQSEATSVRAAAAMMGPQVDLPSVVSRAALLSRRYLQAELMIEFYISTARGHAYIRKTAPH